MKHILICIVMLLMSSIAMGQVNYQKIDNNTFQATKTVSTKQSTYQPTGKYYIDTDGVKYEIHTHTVTKGDNKGKTFCYIKKVSKKSGKSYWKQIAVKPEELK